MSERVVISKTQYWHSLTVPLFTLSALVPSFTEVKENGLPITAVWARVRGIEFVSELFLDFLYYQIEIRSAKKKAGHPHNMATENSQQGSKISPGSASAALHKINRRNKQFWSKQSKLTVQRISDPTLYALAARDMLSEAIRVGFREQKSLDQALADAEQSQNILLESLPHAEEPWRRIASRKGGRALKTDALQVLIETCVRERPDITQRQLWHRLNKHLGLGVIRAIDSQKIEFSARNGEPKTAPVSGLKDRLSRAKSKIDSL